MKILLATTFAAALAASGAIAQDAPGATGTFINADGAEIGTVDLMAMEGGVHITGNVMSIPGGDHGIHFHAVGDCDAASGFESAGDHFNPEDHQHGLENPEGPHAGDLPNLTVPPEGSVALDMTSTLVSLEEGATGYVFDADGTALVIHADPDDQVTDPSGNSGDRIACAVIEAAAGG